MNTSQPYIARIEGGNVRPSTNALERFAHATGRESAHGTRSWTAVARARTKQLRGGGGNNP